MCLPSLDVCVSHCRLELNNCYANERRKKIQNTSLDLSKLSRRDTLSTLVATAEGNCKLEDLEHATLGIHA